MFPFDDVIMKYQGLFFKVCRSSFRTVGIISTAWNEDLLVFLEIEFQRLGIFQWLWMLCNSTAFMFPTLKTKQNRGTQKFNKTDTSVATHCSIVPTCGTCGSALLPTGDWEKVYCGKKRCAVPISEPEMTSVSGGKQTSDVFKCHPKTTHTSYILHSSS